MPSGILIVLDLGLPFVAAAVVVASLCIAMRTAARRAQEARVEVSQPAADTSSPRTA